MDDRYMQHGRQGSPIDFHFVMDSHAHLGQNDVFLVIDSTADGILRVMDCMGVDITAVSSIPGTCSGWTRGNDAVIQAVQSHPDRFLGYITVNGHDPDSVLAECERCWSGGCRALKLHTSQGLDYNRAELRPALEFADDKACPILCHTWGAQLDHMAPLFVKYSRCRWLLGHSGCVQREKYAQTAAAFGNVYLETCFSRCPKGLLEYFVAQGLEDRIVWGSDADFMASTHQIGRVLFAEVDEAAKRKILCDNPRAVFGLADEAGDTLSPIAAT